MCCIDIYDQSGATRPCFCTAWRFAIYCAPDSLYLLNPSWNCKMICVTNDIGRVIVLVTNIAYTYTAPNAFSEHGSGVSRHRSHPRGYPWVLQVSTGCVSHSRLRSAEYPVAWVLYVWHPVRNKLAVVLAVLQRGSRPKEDQVD